MKSYIAGLIFALSFGFSLAAPTPNYEDKVESFLQECNATNPVYRNPNIEIGKGIATGERIILNQHEKCFLFCYLQKVKFLDEDANIRNVSELIKYTLDNNTDLAKYSDVLIASIFQIQRSVKDIDDNCHKAFVTYYQYGQTFFTIVIAEGLQSATSIKDAIVNSIQNGQPIDKEIVQEVKQFLELYDVMMISLMKELEKKSQPRAVL